MRTWISRSEAVAALAAAVLGIAALVFDLIGPTYESRSSSGADGRISLISSGLTVQAAIFMVIVMLVCVSVAVKGVIHARTHKAIALAGVWAATALLALATAISVLSIGLTLLPAVAAAILTAVLGSLNIPHRRGGTVSKSKPGR